MKYYKWGHTEYKWGHNWVKGSDVPSTRAKSHVYKSETIDLNSTEKNSGFKVSSYKKLEKTDNNRTVKYQFFAK